MARMLQGCKPWIIAYFTDFVLINQVLYLGTFTIFLHSLLTSRVIIKKNVWFTIMFRNHQDSFDKVHHSKPMGIQEILVTSHGIDQ